MGAAAVLHRPIVRSGAVIGYLWSTTSEAGFWPRTGAGADDAVRTYWLRWLATARDRVLNPAEAVASWDPAHVFPQGTPAVGPPNELAGLNELRALAEGHPPPGAYANDTTGPVRHYQVICGNAYLGRLWASEDGRAAGFLPSPGLAGDDPAALAWPRRLSGSHAA